MAEQCPACRTDLNSFRDKGHQALVDCPRCGKYSLSSSAIAVLPRRVEFEPTAGRKISYALYRMTRHQQWAMLTTDLIDNIIDSTELPRPDEQLENLLLWLGDAQPSMGVGIDIGDNQIAAIGVEDGPSLRFLVGQAIDAGLLSAEMPQLLGRGTLIDSARLSLHGWQVFDQLKRGMSRSRSAFMAMAFGDAELDRIVAEHFKPAVGETGFDLKRLDDGQPAGLIDDRLRVEIRQSRFLIADLTHQNRGAYWEAGYAEGLGKPVIYTCRRDVFEDKSAGTHFDTNHHLTVVWEADKLPDAVARLKATIRATLPEDAKLSDDSR